jgi:hypothetical protein
MLLVQGISDEALKKITSATRTKSNFRAKITASILKAMEVVPRHLFMEPTRVSGSSTKEKIETVYNYNQAMGATEWSNESSPEIIGIQVQKYYKYFYVECCK